MEAADIGIREILDNGERSDLRGDAWEGDRAEVLLQVAQQGIAHVCSPYSTRPHHHAADGAVGGLAQQHAHLGDAAEVVDPHRDGVHVHEGHVGADVELVV